MTMKDGRFEEDTKAEILDAMIADAKEYFGEDLNDAQYNVIREFYDPIAERLAVAQGDIGLVLDSSQIDHASEEALDLLTALIGIRRDEATPATGTAEFTRSTPADNDYTVPEGTVAQTDSQTPVMFETTAAAIISGPATDEDTTTYSTTSGTFAVQTSFTIDVTYRNTVDVQADFRTTDDATPVTAYLEIADATNGVVVQSDSTTSGTFVTSGPVTYDVSSLTGNVKFEYRLKSGDGATSVELTNATAAKGGETGTTAAIEAVEGGLRSNVGPNTVVVMPDPPAGVEDVTNPAETTGGTEREDDDELRTRAKDELAEGSRASAPALVNAMTALQGVTSVSIFVNDTNSDNTGSGGLPDHSFELVVAGGNDTEIAQAILETKAAGDTSYAGANGTATSASADLPNGQVMTIEFSRPVEVQIYVDVDLEVTSEYAGDTAVQDAIVNYIGGLLTSGNDVTGLGVDDDVIYTEVMAQVQMVEGVHDVPTLEIGTSADPTGTSNIVISSSEVAIADGTDGSLTVTTTQV